MKSSANVDSRLGRLFIVLLASSASNKIYSELRMKEPTPPLLLRASRLHYGASSVKLLGGRLTSGEPILSNGQLDDRRAHDRIRRTKKELKSPRLRKTCHTLTLLWRQRPGAIAEDHRRRVAEIRVLARVPDHPASVAPAQDWRCRSLDDASGVVGGEDRPADVVLPVVWQRRAVVKKEICRNKSADQYSCRLAGHREAAGNATAGNSQSPLLRRSGGGPGSISPASH